MTALRPRPERLRRLLVAGSLLLVLGLAGAAGAAERRCEELGIHCVCSEPFAGPERSVDDYRQNPGDSTLKECNDGAALTNATPRPVPAAGLGLPAVATLTHVWEDEGVHGGAVEGNTPERPGSERICVRYYVRYDHDYQFFGDGACRAGKLTQIDLGSDLGSAPLHAEAKSDQWRVITQGLGGNAKRATGRPSPEDCRGQWCRVELCIAGDIARGRDLYFDGYVQSLRTGERAVWNRELRGSTPDGGGVHPSGMWLMNLYREGSCSGRRWFTHVMQAEWSEFDPLRPGPYIGAAYEIEGYGGSGPGAPDPAPDPAAAARSEPEAPPPAAP